LQKGSANYSQKKQSGVPTVLFHKGAHQTKNKRGGIERKKNCGTCSRKRGGAANVVTTAEKKRVPVLSAQKTTKTA